MAVCLTSWLDAAGELLDTLPPGIDEAVAISKVVQFLKSPDYSHFQHIVFDTAPTGHTLRLLTLPDFLDKTIGGVQLHDACCTHFQCSPPPPHPLRPSFHAQDCVCIFLVSLFLALISLISPIFHRETGEKGFLVQ